MTVESVILSLYSRSLNPMLFSYKFDVKVLINGGRHSTNALELSLPGALFKTSCLHADCEAVPELRRRRSCRISTTTPRDPHHEPQSVGQYVVDAEPSLGDPTVRSRQWQGSASILVCTHCTLDDGCYGEGKRTSAGGMMHTFACRCVCVCSYACMFT